MAAIADRRSFYLGLTAGVAFLAVMNAPILDGQTPMQWSDAFFSSLTKSSTHFTDLLTRKAQEMDDRSAAVNLDAMDADAADLLRQAGWQIEERSRQIQAVGNLASLAGAILQDTDDMYRNDSSAVTARRGIEGRRDLYCWWGILGRLDRKLSAEGRLAEAEFVRDIQIKAVEVSYNFHGIEPRRVGENIPVLSAMLTAYIVYTVWLGGAIYMIFRGLGLQANRHRPTTDPSQAD